MKLPHVSVLPSHVLPQRGMFTQGSAFTRFSVQACHHAIPSEAGCIIQCPEACVMICSVMLAVDLEGHLIILSQLGAELRA